MKLNIPDPEQAGTYLGSHRCALVVSSIHKACSNYHTAATSNSSSEFILTVLGVKNCRGMTTPHMLHWAILSWNFKLEHVDMILGRNVEYRHSMLGLVVQQ